MKVLVLSGTPKQEGLSASALEKVIAGVQGQGAQAEIISLCALHLSPCRACGEGWGCCREEHVCAFGEDGLTKLQQEIASADALVLLSPVYWGEVSEPMKCALDRLRRCEALRDGGIFKGKPVLLVASPGGSGNGLVTTLAQMERFCQHNHAVVFDMVGLNRRSREYKLSAVQEAAAALVRSMQQG